MSFFVNVTEEIRTLEHTPVSIEDDYQFSDLTRSRQGKRGGEKSRKEKGSEMLL
jgi:hypothetical protein